MILDSLIPKNKTEEKEAPSSVSVKKKRPSRPRRKKVVHTKRAYHRPSALPLTDQVRVFDVLERPLITEKAATLSERGVYIFFVRPFATKHSVITAIEAVYGVRPAKVRITRYPSKRKRIRVKGREREMGSASLRKRAYVYLKEGDKIEVL